MSSHTSKNTGHVEPSSRISPTQRKRSSQDALRSNKEPSILPSFATHDAKALAQQQQQVKREATSVKNGKSSVTSLHASNAEKKLALPHFSSQQAFALPALRTVAGTARVGEREISQQSIVPSRNGNGNIRSGKVNCHNNSSTIGSGSSSSISNNNNSDSPAGGSNLHSYPIKSQFKTANANSSSSETSSVAAVNSKAVSRGGDLHHMLKRFDRTPSTCSTPSHQVSNSPPVQLKSVLDARQHSHVNSGVAGTPPTPSNPRRSIASMPPTAASPALQASNAGAAGGEMRSAVSPASERPSSPSQAHAHSHYGASSTGSANVGSSVAHGSSNNDNSSSGASAEAAACSIRSAASSSPARGQLTALEQEDAANRMRRASQLNPITSLPQLKRTSLRRDGAPELVAAQLASVSPATFSSVEQQQQQRHPRDDHTKSDSPTSTISVSVKLNLFDGGSENAFSLPSPQASTTKSRCIGVRDGSAALSADNGTHRTRIPTLRSDADDASNNDPYSLLNSLVSSTNEGEDGYRDSSNSNTSPAKHAESAFETAKSGDADTLSGHTEPHIRTSARGSGAGETCSECVHENGGGTGALASRAESNAMSRIQGRRGKYNSTVCSHAVATNNNNNNNNSSNYSTTHKDNSHDYYNYDDKGTCAPNNYSFSGSNCNNVARASRRKSESSAERAGGGLATFDTAVTHNCTKCGSNAIEYVSEGSNEEMYMCEDCYFADYGAHRMVPIRDTHCMASRTMVSSSYSALTSSNVVSSLLYNPCNECGRMIDDTEVVYRCERCDFIVCDACFCTKTIQHEDELRRFQRRIPSESVYETTFINRSRSNEGNKIINDYVIVRFLGQGSSAKVKLVQHIHTHDLFALKIIRVNGAKASGLVRNKSRLNNAEYVLAREVAVMKFVSHPNIVQLQEVIEDVEAHKVYIIMEYCSGGPIHTLNKPPLSLGRVRKYGADILRGLLHLHSEYLFHRDVKPANCLVNCDDVAKLADFGTCSSHVTSNTAYGTMPYNSPEQIRGENVSGEIADSWAFGMTLYQSAFGKLPFELNTLWELRTGIGSPDPVQFPAGCDAVLLDLLQKMLDKNLSTRLLLSGAARHPFFQDLCAGVEEGVFVNEDSHGSYDSISLWMSPGVGQVEEGAGSSAGQSSHRHGGGGDAGEKETTAMQRVADLYSQASHAVVRGNNVKDFFHGVKPIMLMRRRLRKQNSATSMSGGVNSMGLDRAVTRVNSNSTDDVLCLGKSTECNSSTTDVSTECGGTHTNTGPATKRDDGSPGNDTANDNNSVSNSNNDNKEKEDDNRNDNRKQLGAQNPGGASGTRSDTALDAPCASRAQRPTATAAPSGACVGSSFCAPPPGAVPRGNRAECVAAGGGIEEGTHDGYEATHNVPSTLGSDSADAPHSQNINTITAQTSRNSGNDAPHSASNGKSDITSSANKVGDADKGGVQTRDSASTLLLPKVFYHCATTDLIKHVRVYIPEAPVSLNAYSGTVVRMIFTFNELSSVSNINFAKFVLLKEITIASNNLTRFPEEVLAAPRLQRLDLSNNKIPSIPATVRQAYFLERINLYNNLIEYVGVVSESSNMSVLSGPCLRHVRLSANPLRRLPLGLDVPLSVSSNDNNGNNNGSGSESSDGNGNRAPCAGGGGVLAANSLPDLQIVLDADPKLMSEWSTLLQRGATNSCWRSVVVIWDDYFPTYVSDVPFSIWIAKGHVSLYQPHILRSCGVKHVVINSVDRRLPVGIMTGPQLQSYFAKATSTAGGSFSYRRSSSNSSSGGDGLAEEQLARIASTHSPAEQTQVSHSPFSSSLLPILSKEASDLVQSYFFISANIRNFDKLYIAIARYFHHILTKNEGVLVLTYSTTGETFETTLAALSDVLCRVSNSERDVKYYCEKVMAALCGLYD